MNLEQRIAEATEDLERRTVVDPAIALARLRRTNRRRRAATIAGAAAAVVLASTITVWVARPDASTPEPAPPTGGVTNGMLAFGLGGGVAVIGGELESMPADIEFFAHLSFSGDGSELVYNQSGGHIVALDVETGAVRELGRCPGGFCVAGVSQDTTRIAVSRHHAIVVRDADGDLRIDLPGLTPAHPVWSPDGERIAFSSPDGLYVVGADGTGLRRVAAERPDASLLMTPSWSPDGGSLAFLNVRPTGSSDVRRAFRFTVSTVDLVSGEVNALADAGFCFCNTEAPAVAWSPDGRLVGFAGVGAKSGVFAVPAQGGEVERLSTQPAMITLAWQPVGS